ncbi:MAG: EamA family transporter [Propionibacteriaceae bacterium]|nr:EamA family transporter [Propionibacteriaceae bacterium]
MRKAILLVLGAIVSVQFGSAIAKSLFPLAGPLALVWLRVTAAGLIMLAVVRPRPRRRTRADWATLAWYSVSLITMNVTFYQAISHIPVGLTVTLEFLGPLGVAVYRSRGARDLIWVGLAGAGVAVLGWSPGSLNWPGVILALVAGACWASYILAAPHVGRHWPGAEPVAWANLLGGVALVVPVLTLASTGLTNPWFWVGGLGLGLLSSVIPYGLELSALRTLDQRIFSIMMSIEPAMAACTALLILGERLTATEVLAMACIIAASAGITWTASHPKRP